MAEDAGCNVESPASLKSFLDENDKKKESPKETEMTDKKDDAAKDGDEKPNEMKS